MNSAKKLCRYCGSEMYISATLCPTCKSYQDKWRTIVLYIASIAGFLALFASAIAFTASRVAEVIHNYRWKDNAEVLYFRSGNSPHFKIVMANTGDGPIFIRELRILWMKRNNVYQRNNAYHIDVEVDINKFYTSDTRIELELKEYDAYIANGTGNAKDEIINNATTIVKEEIQRKPCFFAIFYSANAGDIERMDNFYKQYHKRLVSGPVDATLYFYSAHFRRLHEVKVPMVVTFLSRLENSCMDTSRD